MKIIKTAILDSIKNMSPTQVSAADLMKEISSDLGQVESLRRACSILMKTPQLQCGHRMNPVLTAITKAVCGVYGVTLLAQMRMPKSLILCGEMDGLEWHVIVKLSDNKAK